jgi:hypothetical protein
MNEPALDALIGVVLAGCTITKQAGEPRATSASLESSLASPDAWQAQLPSTGVGYVVVDPRADGIRVRISSAQSQQARAVSRVDISRYHGKRIRVNSRVQLQNHKRGAFAVMRVSLERAGRHAGAWDSSSSSRDTGDDVKILETVLDVTDDTTALQIELIVDGDATAAFDVPNATVVPHPIDHEDALSQIENDRLQALARLIGYIRFFHPSDQSATLEWPALEVEAVHRLLAVTKASELRTVFNWLIRTAAPTAQICDNADLSPPISLPRGKGTRLTRWVRLGYKGEPYAGFRTGLDEPANVGVVLSKTVPAGGCKHARVHSSVKIDDGSPTLELYLAPRRGSSVPSMKAQIVGPEATIEGDVPTDAGAITFGIRVGGEGTVRLSGLDLTCGVTPVATLTANDNVDPIGLGYHLYDVSTDKCEKHSCIKVSRRADLDDSPSHSVIDVEIGVGLRLRMPVAVWTDGKHTYPHLDAEASFSGTSGPADRASRLAVVLDVWNTLRWFYPYFDDVGTNWDKVLPVTLDASARATSADGLLGALAQMLAELKDGHASVTRPTYDNGVLPLSFRLIAGTLYLTKGLGAYDSLVPKGSILETFNGEAASAIVERVSGRLSAATSAWRDAYLPIFMGYGLQGTFVSLKIRAPDGIVTELDVPRVDRSKYPWHLREVRPATGAEISAGVYYIDLANLDLAAWDALVPKLDTAKGLVFDARGPANSVAFHALAHLSDVEMKSPYWDTPIVDVHQTKRYERLQWVIAPEAPRFAAKIVFLIDGRTLSTSETVMQIVRSYHLGTMLGESTGGTNGDVATFDTLGGLRIRFTGLRTLNPDGTLFHGRGISPTITVHPTPDGVVSGRDELMEAAIRQF